MDFPAYKTEQSNLDLETIKNALGMKPYNFLSGFYGLAIFKNEEEIISISPKFSLLKKLPIKGIIATAPGKNSDFVSRFFAPNLGIDEDPVTGSAHCLLIPYWYNQLKKTQMIALQLSIRGGKLYCSYNIDRVQIGGQTLR